MRSSVLNCRVQTTPKFGSYFLKITLDFVPLPSTLDSNPFRNNLGVSTPRLDAEPKVALWRLLRLSCPGSGRMIGGDFNSRPWRGPSSEGPAGQRGEPRDGRSSVNKLVEHTHPCFLCPRRGHLLSGLFGESKQDQKPEAAFQKLLQLPD